MIVFYHDDLDGRASAAIVKHYDSSARCFIADHYKPLPIDEIKVNESVVIVDFTPVSQIDWDLIWSKTAFVTWIDHHKKNIVKYPKYANLDGLRSDTFPSGALLTWEYFYGPKKMEAPHFVNLVSDYDTYVFKYGDETRRFEAGMSTLDQNPNAPIWENLFTNKISTDELFVSGDVVLAYRKQVNKETIAKAGFETVFENCRCFACNAEKGSLNLFESVFDQNYDIYIPFFFDGKGFRFTLFTKRNDLDVSEIAIRHGGGGHPKASGFESKTIPFMVKGNSNG
jgi:uncharacterized protein